MRRTPTFVATVASLVLTAGCGGPAPGAPAPDAGAPVAESAEAIAEALDAANGGLAGSDEADAFGDPALAALVGFDGRFADAADQGAEIAARPGARRFALTLFWGHLPPARDTEDGAAEGAPRDWAGSIAVDAGAVRVRRTLGFEGDDRIAPRSDARRVELRSRTAAFVDGVRLEVLVPALTPAVLHVELGGVRTDVPLATLGLRVGGVERLPDGANGLVYLGYEEVAACRRGFVYGRWSKVQARLGVLRGIVEEDGAATGWVRGIWGRAPAKQQDLFFGKHIAKGGAFAGLFGGTYAGGELKGLWGAADADQTGTLEGFYSDGVEASDGRGVWLGRWSARCGR